MNNKTICKILFRSYREVERYVLYQIKFNKDNLTKNDMNKMQSTLYDSLKALSRYITDNTYNLIDLRIESIFNK